MVAKKKTHESLVYSDGSKVSVGDALIVSAGAAWKAKYHAEYEYVFVKKVYHGLGEVMLCFGCTTVRFPWKRIISRGVRKIDKHLVFEEANRLTRKLGELKKITAESLRDWKLKDVLNSES